MTTVPALHPQPPIGEPGRSANLIRRINVGDTLTLILQPGAAMMA